MSTPILQSRLPIAAWMEARTARLPGIQPVEGEDWLQIDDAFAAQMAERDRLVATKLPEVVAMQPEGRAAAEELYAVILARLAGVPGYHVGAGAVTRPDGVSVALDPARPLETLARLVQEDLCLMEKRGEEHVLTGAALCFPASWSLEEKLGRPLIGIHRTVRPYDPDIARRVQRMFDAMRPDQALWRMNALVYVDPTLHQPGREDATRTERRSGQYLRAERQTLKRLPGTGAVLFAIHTYVVTLDSLTPDERAGLQAARL